MAAADEALAPRLSSGEESRALARQWRGLTRLATLVAVATSPAVFVWLHDHEGLGIGWSIVATFLVVIAFRGLVDLLFRRSIPWPSLFGIEEERVREQDVVNRRRVWFWRWWFRLAVFVLAIVTIAFLFQVITGHNGVTWWGTAGAFGAKVHKLLGSGTFWTQAAILPIFFLFNFLILMGPLMLMGITQMQSFEPGDADWGVRLDHVRGQEEAKQDVRRVVNLWQSGEAFEKAGGKRERGLLFLGAPGTGKTMLSKAIATGFNSPFLSMPGSGFAQTFIGMDVVIVRYMARKAKKLARKWGGQCIVFIDEIDAVGRRRSALGGETGFATPRAGTDSFEDHCFHGPWGAATSTGDLVLETRAWRERLFAERAERRAPNPFLARLTGIVNQVGGVGLMGGGMGQLALNQLLVVMDGIDNPPFFKRLVTNKINSFLDAAYVFPRRVGKVSLRLPTPRPRGDQIYFIGATNVPLEVLDPALTRPGRMGRHVWFRTPTQKDRLDVFDLYISRVAHEPELDTPERRDELARITNGYAQPLTAKVATPSGWKQMGELEVGDVVIGGNGAPTAVVGVHPRGEMETFRVTFNDGTSTECTADHLWSVDALDPRMVRRTLTTRELVERDLRWSRKGSRFYVPTIGPARFADECELPLDPYLVGLLLGDGGIAHLTPDFCTADPESLEWVEGLVPASVHLSQHGPRNWRLSSRRRGVPRSEPNPLTGKLREIGLWGLTSHDKFVPPLYKWSGIASRLAVLQGLMDTDGSIDYRRGTGAEFYSHSRRLADDVAFLVRSLGGNARVLPKRDGWRTPINLPDGLIPFRLPRKAAACRSAQRSFRKSIESIEPIGTKPVQCITVAAEDGLYATDDFIVTHNSPAQIEQVCSMALTYAHHEGRAQFGWDDIVEAMTTVESGTAINIEYVPEETRGIAIHEAGHAVAGHVYMKGAESTRLSIRRRGGALGHHQALEKEERFTSWRSEELARLIWTLGAMAAEYVFYGENSTGVGGDIHSATARTAWMVGSCGMAPPRPELNGGLKKGDDEDEVVREIRDRFRRIGTQVMIRSGAGAMHDDQSRAVFGDPDKRALATEFLGQAFMAAYHLVQHNKQQVEHIAEQVIERKELYGNELLKLLDDAKLEVPYVDLTKDESWPKI